MNYRQSHSHDTSGQLWVIVSGLLISTVGFGLLMLLNENAVLVTQIIFPLIAGIGLGMLFHAPYQVFLRALKPKELATGTSAFFLVRFTGATVGLAVAGAVFDARASARLPSEFASNLTSGAMDYSELASIEPIDLRQDVLRIVASSIQTVWAVCSPCLGLAFLFALCIRKASTEETSTSHCQNTRGTQCEKQAEVSATEKV
ncbi:hypothetical protein AX16_005594 [Volvariella volvacea WC 439]|nr:hypothetical protein AX16_005594 [Volvariella volvacea WC 439]